MDKNEIALELTKLISEKVISSLAYSNNSGKPEKAIVEVYNYIYEHLNSSEQ